MCPGATIAARWPALGEDLDAETLHHDTTSMAEIGGKVGDGAGTQHPWLCSLATVLQRNITSPECAAGRTRGSWRCRNRGLTTLCPCFKRATRWLAGFFQQLPCCHPGLRGAPMEHRRGPVGAATKHRREPSYCVGATSGCNGASSELQ